MNKLLAIDKLKPRYKKCIGAAAHHRYTIEKFICKQPLQRSTLYSLNS
jgi:hypothetical protein